MKNKKFFLPYFKSIINIFFNYLFRKFFKYSFYDQLQEK